MTPELELRAGEACRGVWMRVDDEEMAAWLAGDGGWEDGVSETGPMDETCREPLDDGPCEQPKGHAGDHFRRYYKSIQRPYTQHNTLPPIKRPSRPVTRP